MTEGAALARSDQRVVRVFVSSTFRDMQADRDEPVKRVFPRLRKLCESRGVTWSEVDLRWGITDEEKAEGRVLPICLPRSRAAGRTSSACRLRRFRSCSPRRPPT